MATFFFIKTLPLSYLLAGNPLLVAPAIDLRLLALPNAWEETTEVESTPRLFTLAELEVLRSKSMYIKSPFTLPVPII